MLAMKECYVDDFSLFLFITTVCIFHNQEGGGI
jgi:hypothetical protein